MRKHYDFTTAKPNPYAKRLKKQLTIRLDMDTVAYFRSLAKETAVPYQTLINLYLRDCAQSGRRLAWRPTRPAAKACGVVILAPTRLTLPDVRSRNRSSLA